MINDFGGISNYLPKYSFLFLIFALAALGLPGTSGFLGEFLVLVGTFQKNYLASNVSNIRSSFGSSLYVMALLKELFLVQPIKMR